MGTVAIRRSTLTLPDAARLIAALRIEVKATLPEPGSRHFSLTDAQVEARDGPFVVAYLDEVAVGCGGLTTASVEGCKSLRLPKVCAFLNPRLEEGWKWLSMGGEQALDMLAPHLWPDDIVGSVASPSTRRSTSDVSMTTMVTRIPVDLTETNHGVLPARPCS